MASIQKTESGKWQYRVSYKDKKTGKFRTKNETFIRKSDAINAARKLEMDKDVDADISKKNITFLEYYDEWITTYRLEGVSDGTATRYKHLKKIINEYFPNELLVDITKEKYQKFINQYGKKLAMRSIQKDNSYIRGMSKEAVYEGIIPRDFTHNIKLVAGKPTRNPNAKFLELNDFIKLKNHAKARASLLNTSAWEVYFACESGARYEEIAALSWDCVNFEMNTILFDKAYDSKKKRNKSTKNTPSYRTIGMPKVCMDNLKILKTQQEKYFYDHNFQDPENHVFLDKSRLPTSNKGVNTMLQTLLDECKITKKIKFHDLRHTHVAYLFYKKFDLLYVSKRLGHKSYEQTLKTYSHVMNQGIIEQNKRLDEVFTDNEHI